MKPITFWILDFGFWIGKCDRKAKNSMYAFCLLSSVFYLLPAQAQNNLSPQLTITVNSDRDGSIQPDDTLTLREAISLANGTLSPEPLRSRDVAMLRLYKNIAQIFENEI